MTDFGSTKQPGDGGHAQIHRNIGARLDQLTDEALWSTFVAVRTSDGQPLAPGTIVVITLDKTLAEITSTPVADIADITFEEA